MTTYQARIFKALKDVRVFKLKHGNAFAPTSKATERFALNEDFIARVETMEGHQTAGGANYHGGTNAKNDDVKQLRALIKQLVETGKTVFHDLKDPANESKMRVPAKGKLVDLLSDAREFRAIYVAFQPQFEAEEMPLDFLAQLDAAIAAVQAEDDAQEAGGQTRSGATAGLKPLLEEALKNVRALDAPINNKFAGQPDVLREWEVASHVEVGEIGGPKPAPKAAKSEA